MMETKDWVSFFIGILVTAAGALPLLHSWGVLSNPIFQLNFLVPGVIKYLLAGLGLYLIINSIIEITNSNAIGWISGIVAVIVMAAGLLPLLAELGVLPPVFSLGFLSGPSASFIYNILFVVEGIFLMIAAFAMEM